MRLIYLTVAFALMFAGCSLQSTKTPLEIPKIKPIVRIDKPDFAAIFKVNPKDDENFSKALSQSKLYYSKDGIQKSIFKYDDQNYTGSQMLASLELFEKIAKESNTTEQFVSKISENFDVYESKNEKNGTLITGYYAPVLKASFEKTDSFTAPIYPVPESLVTIKLNKFSKNLPNKELIGVVKNSELLPFYTREQIETGALADTKPLMYLENKVDTFFLEVQGSGIVEMENGERHVVRYAGKNGRPYSSIGNVFGKEKLIPSDQINMQTMREYLLNHPDSMQRILNTNESYVFFRIGNSDEIFGNIQLPLTAESSIAMDSALMPKGALVYIKTAIPYKKSPDETVVPRTQREPFEKFFLIQDTGGAIKGGGRVDMYFGEGDEAFFVAGEMAGRGGQIYLVVAKKEKLTDSNKAQDNIEKTLINNEENH